MKLELNIKPWNDQDTGQHRAQTKLFPKRTWEHHSVSKNVFFLYINIWFCFMYFEQ